MRRSPWRVAGLASAALLCTAALAQTAPSDEARARKIVGGVCFVCHGMEGESSSEAFPRLAGQHAEYIAKQLDNFKSGKRKSTAMAALAAKLTPEEMLALGRYFEKQQLAAEPAKNAALAEAGRAIYHQGKLAQGVIACANCHGVDARGTAELPRLAGQIAAYTEAQLKSFHQRERTNDNAVMHTVVQKMTPQDMAAVAEYLSSK